MKKLEDLPGDIYDLFDPSKDHVVDEDNLQHLLSELGGLVRRRLAKSTEANDALRFSVLGRPDRQVWLRAKGTYREPLRPKDQFKYLYGDILEQLLIFLTKEAGHTVEDEQKEVSVNGVKGHIDAKIDGVIVDVKSASPFGFKKFKYRLVEQDDPFGYVNQLAGYADVETPGQDAAWFVVDKVHGELCITPLSKHTIAHYRPAPRIKELRDVLEGEMPPRCYDDIPDGKSGNRKLATGCSYCGHRAFCWPNLRTFIYSSGPRFLTQVAREPDVPEVKADIELDDDE